METFWDWTTVLIFAGLITLMLQRSSQEVPVDKLWQYAPPTIACAVANYLGNEGMALFAAILVLAIPVYCYFVLKVRPPGL